jgi:site-specific recombinase XerD
MPSASGWAGNWAAGRCLADKHLKESGLKAERGSGHALRLSATTWSRVGGARLEAIAGMLGHTSVTTTGAYAKIVDKIAKNPARYLGELMGLS